MAVLGLECSRVFVMRMKYLMTRYGQIYHMSIRLSNTFYFTYYCYVSLKQYTSVARYVTLFTNNLCFVVSSLFITLCW